MTVREVLTRSARTTWTHKRLWFYGLFAATAGGGIHVQLDDTSGLGAGVPEWLPAVLAAAGVVGLALSVMHLVAVAALIEGVRDARDGSVSPISEGLRSGWGHLLRVLGVKLVTGLLTVAVVAGVVAPGVAAALGTLPLEAGIAGSVLLALPAVPFVVSLTVVGELALRMVVLEGRPVAESLRHARRMLHTGLVDTLALLVAIAAGRTGLAVALTLPAVALGVIVGGPLYALVGLEAALAGLAVVVLPLGIVLAGVTGTWSSAVWTEGFTLLRTRTA